MNWVTKHRRWVVRNLCDLGRLYGDMIHSESVSLHRILSRNMWRWNYVVSSVGSLLAVPRVKYHELELVTHHTKTTTTTEAMQGMKKIVIFHLLQKTWNITVAVQKKEVVVSVTQPLRVFLVSRLTLNKVKMSYTLCCSSAPHRMERYHPDGWAIASMHVEVFYPRGQ